MEGSLTAVISYRVLEELVGAIKAKKPEPLPLLRTFLTHVPPELCADPTADEVEEARRWINAADAPILAAARRSGADCIVTGNTTPTAARRAGITILTPSQYLDELGVTR